MALYQRLVRDVLYPLDLWRTGDGAELRYLREFERTQFLSPEELRGLAFERLQHMVRHVYERCSFYRNRFDAVGFVPSDLNSPEDISALPILEKRHIQKHRDEMVTRDWPRDDLIPNATGGSTGTPISMFLDHERKCSQAAAAWRHNRWAGWDIGDKAAVIWGAIVDAQADTWKTRLKNVLINRNLMLNVAHVTEQELERFCAAMKRFRPKHILAYAKGLVMVARFIKQQDLALPSPESIVTSAEVLEPSDRKLIEEVFGCPVFNRYGCREVAVIASECSEHAGLHVMAEGLFVEVVKGDRPARSGELGELLVTDLLNRAMPLVRYRIGDMAVREDGACKCGRGLPRLRDVAGRVTDFLVGSDGRLVSGVFLTVGVVARRPTLGQVQLWQDTPGRVLYKIAPTEGRSVANTDLQFLETETKRYVGDDTKVEYEFVEQLAPEPSGKFLFCRSTAACDFLDTATAG